MFADLSLTLDAFSRFLRYRVSDLYRPLADPFPFSPDAGPPRLYYLDGIKIRNAFVNPSSRVDPFFLNERDPATSIPGGIRQIGGINHLDVPRLSVGLLGNLLLAAEDDIVRAGYGEPLQASVMIPPNITMLIRMDVDPRGVPHLLGEPDIPADTAARMGPQLVGVVRRLLTVDQPLPLTTALSQALPRDQAFVVNAGLSMVQGDRVMIRFETGPLLSAPASTTQRLFEWDAFFKGQVPNRLGSQDWAIDLPTQPLVDMAASAVDTALTRQSSFVYYRNAFGFWLNDYPSNPPGLQVVADGHLENVCAGNDVRFRTTITMRITVARPNVVRITVSLGFFKNDWDMARCIALSILNPLFAIITTADLGGGAGGILIEIAHGLVLPKPLITGFLFAALILGLDDAVIRGIVRREVAKQPRILRLPNDEFGIEQDIDTENPETRDWIVVTDAAGGDNRLVLRGQFNVPEPVLPRITGRLTDRFTPWSKQNPCSGGSPLVTRAAIALGLRAADGPPGTRPNVSLKYAVDRAIELHDDPQGVYGAAWVPAFAVTNTWTTIHWQIPGIFEVILANPPSPFAEHPYPLRARFLTSGGVRQYEIPAPPAVPKPQPPFIQIELDRQEMAWRIANCFIHSTLLHIVKALQVHWLPNPQPDLAGQHWQIYLEGLESGRMATVWDQASGRRLATVRSNQHGQLEISMVIPEQRALQAVLVTLDDRPFLTDAEFQEVLQQVPLLAEPAGPSVSVQQTLLLPVGTVSLNSAADHVSLFEQRGNVYLRARGSGRRVETFQVTSGLTLGMVVPVALGARRRQEALQESMASAGLVRVAIDDGERTCHVVDSEYGEEIVVARYWERPWFDGGAVLGPFFARLSDDGRQVSLYRRQLAQIVRPTVQQTYSDSDTTA